MKAFILLFTVFTLLSFLSLHSVSAAAPDKRRPLPRYPRTKPQIPVENQTPVVQQPSDKVKLDFYVMSKCPDAELCEKQFQTAIHSLNPIIDFHLNYIAREEDNGSFHCMHGPTECLGNTQQLCARYVQEQMKTPLANSLAWFDFAVCQSQTRTRIPSNARDCASRFKLNYTAIDECSNSNKAHSLMLQSVSNTVRANETYSCTMTINDVFWCQHNGKW